MAKKSKKTRIRPPVASRPATAGSVAPATEALPARPFSSAPGKVDLAQEYAYVLTDLRRIAIIAVAMFVLLFALALVLK